MKKIVFLVAIIVLFTACLQKKVKISDPQAYNDSLVYALQSVQNPFDTLLFSLYSINIDLNNANQKSFDSVEIDYNIIDKRYNAVNESIDIALDVINRYEFTDDDKGFKESIIHSIDSLDIILETDIKMMISILKAPSSETAISVATEILPIGKGIFRNYSALFINLMKAQMIYNVHYKYVLSDNFILYRF